MNATGTPATDTIPTASQDLTPEAFEFVKALATELSNGTVGIPSFPEVTLRVQRVLSDEYANAERVVRVLGAEPALAARVLSVANSAALNPEGSAITNLRAAVIRVGFDMVRSAAMSFAMAQLGAAPQYKSLEKPMNRLWRRSVEVASLCRVIARRHRELSPDAALLAGLLHRVGHLYILTRAARHPKLFSDQAFFQSIIRDWHADITKALLETWRISDELVEAIHGYEDPDRIGRGPLALGDVLAVSDVVASLRDKPDLLEVKLNEWAPARRLGITRESIEQVLTDCNVEMTALRVALGQ
jgi:HD-like signal output (HDOD) protein